MMNNNVNTVRKVAESAEITVKERLDAINDRCCMVEDITFCIKAKLYGSTPADPVCEGKNLAEPSILNIVDDIGNKVDALAKELSDINCKL